tara:strand:+ start:670 stop:1284 length:615 start_codon:yes stop_codon:yes gene_type:complete
MARDISKKQKESTLAKELKREISQGKKDPKSRKAVAKKVLTGLSLLPIGKAVQVGGKTLKGVDKALDEKFATKSRKKFRTIYRKAYVKSVKSHRNRDRKEGEMLKYAIKEPTGLLFNKKKIDLKATKNPVPKKKVNIDLKATKNPVPKKNPSLSFDSAKSIKGANDLVKAMDAAIERVTGIKSTKKFSRGGGVAMQGTKFKGTF